jgi:hypothetical protein
MGRRRHLRRGTIPLATSVNQRLHLFMTVIWALMAIPTVLWWKESILWVAFMSLYANVVGHWSAYQGSRAEKEAKE